MAPSLAGRNTAAGARVCVCAGIRLTPCVSCHDAAVPGTSSGVMARGQSRGVRSTAALFKIGRGWGTGRRDGYHPAGAFSGPPSASGPPRLFFFRRVEAWARPTRQQAGQETTRTATAMTVAGSNDDRLAESKRQRPTATTADRERQRPAINVDNRCQRPQQEYRPQEQATIIPTTATSISTRLALRDLRRHQPGVPYLSQAVLISSRSLSLLSRPLVRLVELSGPLDISAVEGRAR